MTYFYPSQIPTGVTATVVLEKDKFSIPKRNNNNKCPNDHLKINGIDESAGTFADDSGSENNGVKLCGNLTSTFTYTSVAGANLAFEFKANDNNKGSGFRAKICLSA